MSLPTRTGRVITLSVATSTAEHARCRTWVKAPAEDHHGFLECCCTRRQWSRPGNEEIGLARAECHEDQRRSEAYRPARFPCRLQMLSTAANRQLRSRTTPRGQVKPPRLPDSSVTPDDQEPPSFDGFGAGVWDHVHRRRQHNDCAWITWSEMRDMSSVRRGGGVPAIGPASPVPACS